MKVLMVSRWLWEERRRNGDSPGFFGELAQAIVAKGVDLTLLSQANDAGFVPDPRPVDGLNVHVFTRDGRTAALAPFDKIVKRWGGYRKAVTDASIIRRFALRHGPFDVIVAQCEEPDGLACAIASLPGGLPPLVTQVHDLRYEFRTEGVRFIRKSSLGFVFKRSARVIANSIPTARWLHKEYAVPEDKIGQCRIHLTAPFLAQAVRDSLAPATGNPRILFLGALNEKKGADVFLFAASLAAPDLPGAIFVVVGPETSDDQEYRELIKGFAKNPALANRLEMLGRLDPSTVIDQIRRARVVVCPSLIETFSRATIEALALGRPVIVTETTGAAQWVGSTGAGTIVPPNNPGELANAMRAWTTRKCPASFSSAIISQLTAARAAEDWIREVSAVCAKTPRA